MELNTLKADLLALNQGHLFVDVDGNECSEALQASRLEELKQFSYPGGIISYLKNAKRLLAASATTSSATVEYSSLEQAPIVLSAPSLLFPSSELYSLESAGQELLARTAFVLVAGGLGERLGFSGIKIGLPVETASNETFLEHFMEAFVLWRRDRRCPFFVIMTSDDTHARTLAMLSTLMASTKYHEYALEFEKDILVVKQETVFCLSDNDAHLAVDPTNGKLLRKPHGHGDVHSLLYAAEVGGTKLLDVWQRAGVEHLVFCQDTNYTSTWTATVSLALCTKNNLDLSFTCVPRIPGEAIGLLCNVVAANDDAHVKRTVNIEYNNFDRVFRSLYGKGDVAAEDSPYSPFPGSINTLVYRFTPYRDIVTTSHGSVPEFINPKYADRSRTTFKAPTRVESLMQDIALMYDPQRHRVGGVVFERLLYHPVKNSVAEALAKIAIGGDGHCAATGEENVYELHRRRLAGLGVHFVEEDGTRRVEPTPLFDGSVIKVNMFPIVAMSGSFHQHYTLQGLASRFPQPQRVRISQRSALSVRGNVVIVSLDLDGSLEVINESETECLVIDGLVVKNEGWTLIPLSLTNLSEDDDEVTKMRGFRFDKKETETILKQRTGGEPLHHRHVCKM